jgi:hypothetical protein
MFVSLDMPWLPGWLHHLAGVLQQIADGVFGATGIRRQQADSDVQHGHSFHRNGIAVPASAVVKRPTGGLNTARPVNPMP